MKNEWLATALGGVLVVSCAALEPPRAQEESTPAPTTAPTSSSAPTVADYRLIPIPPGHAQFSPDGRYIAVVADGAVGNSPALTIYDSDGGPVARSVDVGGVWLWLDDGSGIAAEMMAPQRAGPLGVVELDGRLTRTELQVAHVLVSPDHRWLVAEQQEGCCVDIRTHEIRISPRFGGGARALVRSSARVVILGWDAAGRLVYTDGAAIRTIDVDGKAGPSVVVPTGPEPRYLTADGASPDQSAMLLRTYEPDRWWLLVDGSLRPWPDGITLVQRPGPIKSHEPRSAIWMGGHELLVDAEGRPARYDVRTGRVEALALQLPDGARILEYSEDTFLYGLGDDLRIVSTRTGKDVLVLLPHGSMSDAHISSLSGGRFFVRLHEAAYLVSLAR